MDLNSLRQAEWTLVPPGHAVIYIVNKEWFQELGVNSTLWTNDDLLRVAGLINDNMVNALVTTALSIGNKYNEDLDNYND